MNQLRFLSREKLVEYIDEELRNFLNNKGIYEINQYGWLTDDRPDPEYIGLAMWQAEPPSDNSTASLDNEAALSRPSADSIFKNGLEFEGLMKAARHSIGYTYLYHTPGPLGIGEEGCFLHHYSDAVMKLDLATDRLKELFTNSFRAFFDPDCKNFETFNSHCMNDAHYLYCHPFINTKAKLAKHPDQYKELLECFGDLVPLIEQTSFYRLDGLEQIKRSCLSEEDVCFSNKQPDRAMLDGDIVTRDISEWYKLLVKTGSQVFLAEYLLRNFDEDIPSC